MVPEETDGYEVHFAVALMQRSLCTPETERKTYMKNRHGAEDSGRCLEIAERTAFQTERLKGPSASFNRTRPALAARC